MILSGYFLVVVILCYTIFYQVLMTGGLIIRSMPCNGGSYCRGVEGYSASLVQVACTEESERVLGYKVH